MCWKTPCSLRHLPARFSLSVVVLAVWGYVPLECPLSADDSPEPGRVIDAPWSMHSIDTQHYNHNSLSPADVNADGQTDFAVIHEMGSGGLYTVLFHPGLGGDVRARWPKVTIGKGANVEYAWFGDFDGDGNLDLAGVNGVRTADEPGGIKVFWGPGPDRATDPKAWIDGGVIPATADRGHFLYAKVTDIDGDGLDDIVAGGRVLGTHSLEGVEGKPTAGIVWLKAPDDPSRRRDLSQWMLYDIDPRTAGGHGFVFADVDEDGDFDLVNCNADWNTPDDEEMVLWYENPGPGAAAQKQPWPVHVIYRGGEFYSKAQTAVGDLDGDGRDDVVIQTTDDIYIFRKTGVAPVAWERIVLPKPEPARWLPRPIGLADLDGDGRLEIVGMLIHDEQGNLPAGKAAVFFMKRHGDGIGPENWTTHVVKWSDGVNTGRKFVGEKWDHCRFTDGDGDGDLDIVGNCEEHYDLPGRVTRIGVVWFENPGNTTLCR